MDITAIRTILAYLTHPEDTSAGGQSPVESSKDQLKKPLPRLGTLKTCLWICLAVVVSLSISSLR